MPRITGSTCSTDNIHAESCASRCCCSILTILDCNSDVRTKTTMQPPMHRIDRAIQIVTPDTFLQFIHSGLKGCWCCPQVLLSSADLLATPHLWSTSIFRHLSLVLSTRKSLYSSGEEQQKRNPALKSYERLPQSVERRSFADCFPLQIFSKLPQRLTTKLKLE